MNVIQSNGQGFNKNLSESLNDIFAVEALEGDNKYACETCNSKQNGLKGMRLLQLPVYTSFYINRFNFDPVTYERIKLKNAFAFPLTIDLKEFLDPESEVKESEYELFAIMIHRGSAYAGHYHIIIKDIMNEGKNDAPSFYDFNDTMITKLNDDFMNKFQSGSEESGYLLIYRRKNEALPSLSIESLNKDEIIQKIYLENALIASERKNYEALKKKIKVRLVTFSLLVDIGVLAEDDLRRMQTKIPEDLLTEFTIDKENIKEFTDSLESFYSQPLSNYRVFEIIPKQNLLVFYKQKIDWKSISSSNSDNLNLKYGSIIVLLEIGSNEKVLNFFNSLEFESVC